MAENNKTYRIRTKVGVSQNSPIEDKYLTVKLTNEIDSIDIMSLNISQNNAYKFHCSDYGVIVGRAVANGGFGVPNVKVSVFIPASDATKNDPIYNAIYPYTRVTQKNKDKIRYNLLPDSLDDECYKAVGTFPNKRLVLDDDNYLEIYDEYYKFTTKTNKAGDYMIFGVPTGAQILHFDTDLSDIGVLSQKPRDMMYKGYSESQFESSVQFKTDDNLANLPQIISQDDSVYVYPFWGDEDENVIGITRHDIDINYKFEPTCVFMGSIVSDTNSNHISKKCIPTEGMGMMEELITGPGTIEMIRKRQDGSVEQFNVQGTQLIDNNGVWCYQIPMNLDYMITDEYGNLVPSDDPTKGIATRAKVRFRISMNDFENDSLNSFRTKVLVPNNPREEPYNPDYVFGSLTEEDSFRDLMWNNVYTVKSFIPRFQKGNGDRNRRFSGIKQCNYYGENNPIPYNNMRINLSFQFVITCLLVRLFVWAVGLYNSIVTFLSIVFSNKFISTGLSIGGIVLSILLAPLMPILTIIIGTLSALSLFFNNKLTSVAKSLSCAYVDGSLCESLDGSWFFAPNCGKKNKINEEPHNYLWRNMMGSIEDKKVDSDVDFSDSVHTDSKSIDASNAPKPNSDESSVTIKVGDEEKKYQYVITRGIDYFIQCIEITLAQEFRVVQFDFYNDWINGFIYIPRWERNLRRKRKYFLFGKSTVQVRACNDTYTKRFFERKNNLTEQCAVTYDNENRISTDVGCDGTSSARVRGSSKKTYKCHKKRGRKQFKIFNSGGAVHSEMTASGLYAYYFKPCEYFNDKKVNLFATDIVLLGSLSDCSINGTPFMTNELVSTTYQLPSPLAHTDSTEEGFTYYGSTDDENVLLTDRKMNGVFDYSGKLINSGDDGSVTEESGIDWGYVGPGQGEDVKPQAYTPGGHFLGISCVNSESSIKSCVNLKRICEINVWPSQRQEVFNGFNDGNDSTYIDIIPNGLIARDDIADGDIRKVFSTLNKNGLRTKTNSDGFVVYDFEYLNPENFGGEMGNFSPSAAYNEPNPLRDVDGYLAKAGSQKKNEDGDIWNEQEDESEVLNLTPIRRSLDEKDDDYYRFRLGLTGGTKNDAYKKYLYTSRNGSSMPVYDNSFYFYFGLKPGHTALDDFHKKFFAECKQTISTEDMRIGMNVSYNNYCVDDAFKENVEVSIFESAATFSQDDKLRIYSTSIPILITLDSEKLYEYKDNPGNATYIEITGDLIASGMTLGLGKHILTVTDGNGIMTSKIINVIRQNIDFCPSMSTTDFSDSDYIAKPTEELVSGNGDWNREYFDGFFNFSWDNTACPECTGNNIIFSYESKSGRCDEPETSTTECVSVDDCTLVFAGKSHIIKAGKDLDDDIILSYQEFSEFDRVFSGVFVVNQDSLPHVYAGEAGVYNLYVIYEKDGRITTPMLVESGLDVGEPPAIDFDVYRAITSTEDESPITFRNPLIKVWDENKDKWYQEIYKRGELTDTQRWYIRKNAFFVFDSYTNEENQDEYFPSHRTLFVNQYFPSELNAVDCFIDGTQADSFEVTCNKGENKYYEIYLTGVTIDGETLRTPSNNSVFRHWVFYKPYYYKTVIWEGFEGFGSQSSGGYTYVNGVIYNGVVFDGSDGVQTFGDTILNGEYNLELLSGLTVDYIENDFDVERKSTIKWEQKDLQLSEAQNSLLITEGSPKDGYAKEYVPVEYYLETNAVGLAETWGVSFEFIFNGNDKGNKMFISPYVYDYDALNVYWSKNKTLDTETLKKVIETIEPSELKETWDGFIQTAVTRNGVIAINLPNNDGSGASDKFTNGAILLESVKKDTRVFSSDEFDTGLGFLSSRNFIRSGIELDYGYDSRGFKISVITAKTEDNTTIVEKLYVSIPLSDEVLCSNFGQSVDEVSIRFNNEDEEYLLFAEFGYGDKCTYSDGIANFLTFKLADREDGKIDDYTITKNRFTDKVLSQISSGIFNISVKISASAIDGGVKLINRMTIGYETRFSLKWDKRDISQEINEG